MTLYLLRHAQSTANAKKAIAGLHDVSLTKKGIMQALNAGKVWKKKLDVVYVSPLKRARQTAKYFLHAAKQNPIVVVDKRLREKAYGLMEGKTKSYLLKKYGDEKIREWRRGYKIRPPSTKNLPSESIYDVDKRIKKFYGENLKGKKQNILVVSHANPLRSLYGIIKKKKFLSIKHLDFECAKVIDVKRTTLKERVAAND
ncbi:MAG TPA: phosphoglycerate mutase family protein [Acidobacteriota bacterium]|nr:phosphoglycerate mutase family protein [Acidobacteriota bacterium]